MQTPSKSKKTLHGLASLTCPTHQPQWASIWLLTQFDNFPVLKLSHTLFSLPGMALMQETSLPQSGLSWPSILKWFPTIILSFVVCSFCSEKFTTIYNSVYPLIVCLFHLTVRSMKAKTTKCIRNAWHNAWLIMGSQIFVERLSNM